MAAMGRSYPACRRCQAAGCARPISGIRVCIDAAAAGHGRRRSSLGFSAFGATAQWGRVSTGGDRQTAVGWLGFLTCGAGSAKPVSSHRNADRNRREGDGSERESLATVQHHELTRRIPSLYANASIEAVSCSTCQTRGSRRLSRCEERSSFAYWTVGGKLTGRAPRPAGLFDQSLAP